MTDKPFTYDASEHEKIVQKIIYDVQIYISKWMMENYPDFGKKWTDLYVEAVSSVNNLRKTTDGLKKGYEEAFLKHNENFKKEVDEFLSDKHPVFKQIEKARKELIELLKAGEDLNNAAKNRLEFLQEKEKKFTTMTNKMSLSSSLYEDMYLIKESFKHYSKSWANFREYLRKATEDPEPVDYSTLIEDLNFSIRTTNALKNAGITNVKELMEVPESQLEKLRNFGQKCIREIRNYKENSCSLRNELFPPK